MKVAVVGGGAVGLATAHALMEAGAEVVVLERGRCGGATSAGNAGWVTPMLSTPLPAPGVLRQGARWLLDPASALVVRPRADPAFARWLWRFARNCAADRYEAATRALLALNADTLRLFDGLRDAGVGFEQHQAGVLTVALAEEEVEKEWRRMLDLAGLGYPGRFERLDRHTARGLEPSLGPRIAGAVYAPGERHVRPESLTAGLVAALRAEGARIHEGVEVAALRPQGSGWRLETGSDSVEADRVVLAAGARTAALLAGLGTRVPVESAKGYSLTYRTKAGAPVRSLMLQEAKVAATPFAGGLRFAGTLELGASGLELRPRRLDGIRRAAAQYLPGFEGSNELAWAGLRQFLPDGLPVIGRVPTAAGVAAATGHGMLGITLAPATAQALVPLVLEDRLEPVLEPFRLDRAF